MERAIFDKKRESFRKSITRTKDMAIELAVAALAQFKAHGDLSYVQDFYGDLRGAGKNVIRSAPFLAWLTTFAPVELKENKFVKDHDLAAKLKWDEKDAEGNYPAREALFAKAQEKSFFDFAPEQVAQNFKAGDLVEAVEKLIKRYENSKHFVAADEEAKNTLVRLKDVAKTLRAPAANSNGSLPIEQAA